MPLIHNDCQFKNESVCQTTHLAQECVLPGKRIDQDCHESFVFFVYKCMSNSDGSYLCIFLTEIYERLHCVTQIHSIYYEVSESDGQ